MEQHNRIEDRHDAKLGRFEDPELKLRALERQAQNADRAITAISDQSEFRLKTEQQIQELTESISKLEGLELEKWANMNAEERISILKAVEGKAAVAQGRPPAEIFVEPMNDNLFGCYDGKSIRVNRIHLEGPESSAAECLDTIIHEGRHAFQVYAVEHPGLVPPETVQAWAENLANPLRAEEYGHELYRAQPIEADAWDYAARIRHGIFGRQA